MIPENLKQSLDRYAEHKIPTGGFLHAVLANDLMEAVGRADDFNVKLLWDICNYVYNDMPITCHGSYKIVDEWLKGVQDDS